MNIKLKQKLYSFSFIVSALVGMCFSLLSMPTVLAYTCSHSGSGGDGKYTASNGVTYNMQTDSNGDGCYISVPDETDDSKKTEVIQNGVPVKDSSGNIEYTCSGGTQLHDDGHCWTYKNQYVNAVPTYDDGSKIDPSVFQNICNKQGTYYGESYNYNAGNGTCTAGAGCDSVIIGTGDCRTIGDGTKGVGDVLGKDPTTQCAGYGTTYSTTTKDCNWTQDSCGKAQGQWNDAAKSCANSPLQQQQQQQQQQNASGAPQEQYQQCGQYSRKSVTGGGVQTEKIQTNLISCSATDEGVTAIGDILKFGVSALTVLVGVGAVGGIAWEALQYARAQDDSGTVSQARSRIRDIVIGLVVYIFMIAIINWLVPGGVIGG